MGKIGKKTEAVGIRGKQREKEGSRGKKKEAEVKRGKQREKEGTGGKKEGKRVKKREKVGRKFIKSSLKLCKTLRKKQGKKSPKKSR